MEYGLSGAAVAGLLVTSAPNWSQTSTDEGSLGAGPRRVPASHRPGSLSRTQSEGPAVRLPIAPEGLQETIANTI